MKRMFYVTASCFALALIGACGPQENRANIGNNSSSRPNDVPGRDGHEKKDEPPTKEEWISLGRNICKLDRGDQASSSFEITCPVGVDGFAFGGIRAREGLQMSAGNFNGEGPAELSFQKSSDGRRITGHASGKKINISIELEDGRLEVLKIRNEVSESRRQPSVSSLAKETPQTELKKEFDKIHQGVKSRFDSIEPGKRVIIKGEDFAYEGEFTEWGEDKKAHGIGRVTDKSGKTLTTEFSFGRNTFATEGYLLNPAEGLQCAGMFKDMKLYKPAICLENGIYRKYE